MEVDGDNAPWNPFHVGRINVVSYSPAVLFAQMEVVGRVKPKLKRLLKAAKCLIRGKTRTQPVGR